VSGPLAVIQAHPARTDLLSRLREGLAPLDVQVVCDEGEGKPDPWRGYRLCLAAAVASARPHVLVVQDDAIPCFDFACHLNCAIAERPDAVLVLFLAAQPRLTSLAADRARAAREAFAPLHPRDWMPAVAVCYPLAVAERILAWTDAVAGRHSRSDDHMLGRWHREQARQAGVQVLVTVPSLVQHPDDVPSLIGNGNGSHGRNPSRVARHWDG
jgi:hypothetical protein